MKILLIQPPNNPATLAPSNLEPLALEILAATVASDEVQILDLRFEPAGKLDATLNDFRPDVAGISVNNTIHVNLARNILHHIKTRHPRIITIVGGHHPTLVPEDFYTSDVDAIFLGWAEKSFPRYIRHLASGKPDAALPGLILLKNGLPIYENRSFPELSPADIPQPDRTLTARYSRHYKNEQHHRLALVNTARGCPYRCVFCACWKAARGQYLVRPASDVFRELLDIPPGIKRIFFADDNTFFDIARAEELYRLIKSSGMNKKFSGYCRSDTIAKHPDLFKKWREIGLENITIGFEAVDDEKLKKYNKKNRVTINQQAVKILDELNIRFSSYFLIDPDFDDQDFENILNYISDFDLIQPRFVILTPLPGTDLYEQLKDKINLGYDYFDFMHWVFPTRLQPIDFFNNFTRLYYKAYSYKSYFKKSLRNLYRNIIRTESEKQKHVSLPELVLLRLMAFPLRKKLYNQYFKASSE